MKKTKTQKGITLIALLITIVVLLILAAVAISSITNDNILGYATNAAKDYNAAVNYEAGAFEEYEKFLGEYASTKYTLSEAKTMGVINKNGNTYLVDEKGNLVILPAGFKLASDSATDNVLNGVVIEDATNSKTMGSTFVWVPLGTITKADGTTTQIALSNYTNDLDIDAFKNRANLNNGFYIGETEYRYPYDGNLYGEGPGTIGAGVTPTLDSYEEARNRCKAMYSSKYFKTDLLSYAAWQAAQGQAFTSKIKISNDSIDEWITTGDLLLHGSSDLNNYYYWRPVLYI